MSRKPLEERFKNSNFGRSSSPPTRQNTLAGVSTTRSLQGALVVPLNQLVPNFQQVRQHFDQEALGELAEDIKVRGILEPLLVRETEPGTYEIIAGERRYRAAQLAGLEEVPVVIREMDDQQARFAMLAENLQRQDLDPRDEQRFFLALQAEYDFSLRDIAHLINKSAMYVQRRLSGEIEGLENVTQKRNAPLQIVNSVTQKPKDSKARVPFYNPKVYRRVSEFWETALEAVKAGPDAKILEQIKQDVSDQETKLAALKAELATLEKQQSRNSRKKESGE